VSTFTAQVADWVRAEEAYLEAVVRESSQRVVDEMQTTRDNGGNLPFDTGFLRASLIAATDTMPQIREDAVPKDGVTYTYDASPVNLVIAGTKPGQIIYVGYTAKYAAIVDRHGKNPALFVELAAQRWPQIVAQVQAELGQRLGR
jgi:hypothetical protein